MANKTLPELTAGIAVSDSDIIISRQGADTEDIKTTFSSIKTWIQSFSLTQTQVATGTDNEQTDPTYTLVLTDQENKTIQRSNASDHTTTIPLDSAVAFPTGTKISMVWDGGAGIPTINVSSGVTLNGVLDGSCVINTAYQGATFTKRGTNLWTVAGDISVVA